jgi:hypothetical protein
VKAPRRVRLLAIVVAIACLVPVASARAALIVKPGSSTVQALDAGGEVDARAGSHPDHLVLSFAFEDTGGPEEDPKDMTIDFSAGLSGDPNAVPACSRQQISLIAGRCPAASQVGLLGTLPLYSVEPAPNEAVVFAATPFVTPLMFVGHLRPGDQGLSLRLSEIEHSPFQDFEGGDMTLWGVPADHQEGTSIPRRPLLTMPTSCGGEPLTVTTAMSTWQHRDVASSDTGSTGRTLTGCDALPFDPSVGITLDDALADTPTGAAIDLTVPQNDDPDGRATSQVKDVDILLPAGMTISPAGASGLKTCSDAQIGLRTDVEPSCPAASRVGTVELAVPSLGKPLRGSIYLGDERPGDRFRLFAAAGSAGTLVKFSASLRADPVSGRLTTALANLPRASFGRLSLRFDGGPRALLATPLACGRAASAATIVPYSAAKAVQWTGTVAIARRAGAPCGDPLRFAPTFSGGSLENRAGRATAFTTTIRRGDGEALPQRLTVSFPPGVSAALGKVDPCPEAAIARLACPASSRLGATVAELGPGSNPAPMNGELFLTGPYRDASHGLAMAFDARVGPFDLGNLVVRGALRVDPFSGQVSAAMDTLPTILEGIPIRFQTIGLDLDRPGFLHNPTSCRRSAVTAALRSDSGVLAQLSSPFSVQGCIDLPFRPRFTMDLTGAAQLHAKGRPGLRIGALVPAGNASLRGADIAFPRILALKANGVQALCARRLAQRGDCPPSSRVGSGFARTPLLSKPMKGSIFLVQPRGAGSPDLWTSLDSEGLRVSLRAETAVRRGRAETRLVDLPDFPLSSFAMVLNGGEHGLFELRRDPCRAGSKLLAPMRIAGQNGAAASLRAAVGLPRGCRRG